MSLWKWRKRRQRELEEELSIHMDMAIADRIQHGETPAEAEMAALREFGNRLLVSESVRRAWGWALLESFAQDLRYGCRLLRTARGFTALAILALSLGIGAATVMFGVLDGVLLNPFPYPQGDRLVALSVFDLNQSEEAGRRWTLSPEERRIFEQSASLLRVSWLVRRGTLCSTKEILRVG